MTCTILLFGLALGVQSPTGRMYEEVQRALHEAYRKLDDYHERMEVEFNQEGEITKMVIERWIARDRYRMAVTARGEKTMLAGHDGRMRWAILYPHRTYMVQEEENSLFLSPWRPHVWDAEEEGSIHFALTEAYNMAIDANPSFALELLERVKSGEREEWHCRATTPPSASGGRVTVEMWLDASRWVMQRFTLRITSSDGVSTIEGRVVEQTFEASLSEELFLFPQSETKGFSKIDFPLGTAPGVPSLFHEARLERRQNPVLGPAPPVRGRA